MQKLRTFSYGKITDKNLPSLKSSALTSKAMMAISKVDIDSRAIMKDRNSFILNAGEKDHQRSMSGLGQKREIKKQSESANKLNFQLQSSNHFKLYLKDVKEELTQTQQTSNQALILDKSKVSSKSYGIIKGYSANSHVGLVNSYNEDRICIVTNLSKTNIKARQVSFFGIYVGNDGVARADYMRDHFHGMLLAQELFWKDLQAAVRKVLKKINKFYLDDQRFIGDTSNVAFVVVLLISNAYYKADDQIHYFQCGDCKSVVSKNFGQFIASPLSSNDAIVKESTRKAKSVSELLKRPTFIKIQKQIEESPKSSLFYKKMNVFQQHLDFILLGSTLSFMIDR